MTFNLSTTAKVPPFSFTSPTTSTTNQPTATTTASTGFTLGGLNKTTAPTGITFGTANTTASTTGFGFGAAAPAGTGIAAPQPLGAAAPTTQSFGFGLPTTTSAPGFSFGSTTTSKPAASTGFSFGLTAPTSAATTTSGLGAPAPGFAFSTTNSTQANAAPAFKGLGGVNPTEVSGTSGTAGTAAKSGDGKRGKETDIPNEVANTVEMFKKSLAEQKSIRDALSKHTDRPFQKVREDLNLLKSQLVEITNKTSRNSCQIKKLKADVVEENKNNLIARRTFETPPGLQFENTAPIIYFSRVLQDFETRLINYKQEIENVEGLLSSSDAHSAVPPQELYQTLKRLHDGFIVVASDLYNVHDAIRKLRTLYLKYRRLIGDTSNPFPSESAPEKENGQCESTRVDLPSLDPQRLFNTWMGLGSTATSQPGAQPTSLPVTAPSAHGLLQGALAAAVSGSGGAGTAAGLGSRLGPGSVLNTTTGAGNPGFSFGGTLGSSSTTGSLNLFGTNTALGNKTSTGTSGLNLFTSNSLTTGGFQLQSPPVGKKKR